MTTLAFSIAALVSDSVVRVRVFYCALAALVKRERDRVHAIAQSTWLRAVIEDMSKMRATARARKFSAENR